MGDLTMRLSVVCLVVVLAALTLSVQAKKKKKGSPVSIDQCKVKNCKLCSWKPSKCKKCEDGFKLTLRKDKCKPPKGPPPCKVENCLPDECTGNKCQRCGPSYTVSGDNRKCRPDKLECSSCPVDNCALCGGKNCNKCKECNEGFRRSWRRIKCLAPNEKDPDCPNGVCPDYDPPDDEDEEKEKDECGVCLVNNCITCTGKRCRRCKTCKSGFRVAWRRKRCLAPGEDDPDCPAGICPEGDPPEDEDEDPV